MTPSPAPDNQLGALTDRIHVIRGERLMLDVDLARLYGVTTARLNQQVKRNPARFPLAFMFQLTSTEFANVNLLQNVTGSLKHRDPKLRPYAFTEHGCLMLSNVLKTQQAIDQQMGRHSRRLAEHQTAILQMLRDIRRLTRFPEPVRREIGFTTSWRK